MSKIRGILSVLLLGYSSFLYAGPPLSAEEIVRGLSDTKQTLDGILTQVGHPIADPVQEALDDSAHLLEENLSPESVGAWVIAFLKNTPPSHSRQAAQLIKKYFDELERQNLIEGFNPYLLLKNILLDYVFTEFPHGSLWSLSINLQDPLIRDIAHRKNRHVGAHLIILLVELGTQEAANLLDWMRIKATVLGIKDTQFFHFRSLISDALRILAKKEIFISPDRSIRAPFEYCSALLRRSTLSGSRRYRWPLQPKIKLPAPKQRNTPH